jgi:hypothetical protein
MCDLYMIYYVDRSDQESNFCWVLRSDGTSSCHCIPNIPETCSSIFTVNVVKCDQYYNEIGYTFFLSTLFMVAFMVATHCVYYYVRASILPLFAPQGIGQANYSLSGDQTNRGCQPLDYGLWRPGMQQQRAKCYSLALNIYFKSLAAHVLICPCMMYGKGSLRSSALWYRLYSST